MATYTQQSIKLAYEPIILGITKTRQARLDDLDAVFGLASNLVQKDNDTPWMLRFADNTAEFFESVGISIPSADKPQARPFVPFVRHAYYPKTVEGAEDKRTAEQKRNDRAAYPATNFSTSAAARVNVGNWALLCNAAYHSDVISPSEFVAKYGQGRMSVALDNWKSWEKVFRFYREHALKVGPPIRTHMDAILHGKPRDSGEVNFDDFKKMLTDYRQEVREAGEEVKEAERVETEQEKAKLAATRERFGNAIKAEPEGAAPSPKDALKFLPPFPVEISRTAMRAITRNNPVNPFVCRVAFVENVLTVEIVEGDASPPPAEGNGGGNGNGGGTPPKPTPPAPAPKRTRSKADLKVVPKE